MKIKKMLSAILCSMMVLTACVPSAFAAKVPDATIDTSRTGSLTLYKYDFTNAEKDGVWNRDSFISTGMRESYVEEILGGAIRKGDANGNPDNPLGNGQNSNGYAIKGVEFTTLKVADIVTFTESVNDGHAGVHLTQVLYGFDKTASADLLQAIGLGDGTGRYENADKSDKLDHANYYYTSDTLNKSLYNALSTNSTTVKDALESYIAADKGAIAMPLTDENGMSTTKDLPVGLYLCVETKVPEMVTNTTNPFFVSIPMTTVTGNSHSVSQSGGTEWLYDVTVYPKNETGIPTLEKTVRESKPDTGKNNGSDIIDDGFAHNGTGSTGDVMEYQVISSLPTITSKATSLSVYNFYDTISAGLDYNQDRQDVKLEFFTDKACTDKVATWTQADGKFNVTYSEDGRHMTIDVTKTGLDEINGRTENVNGIVYMGYSNYTVRVTYTATINADESAVIGQNGNDNKVVLTWKRTSSDYYDTLIDDAHVYTFGIDLTKQFVDQDNANAAEMLSKVKFKIWNETDKYWVTAQLNEAEGVYYVTGHVASEAEGTVFTPVTSNGVNGKIIVKGCEDDEYVITEIETANGYTLLKDDIHVVITSADDASRPCAIYGEDALGVLQNDPHYAFDGGKDLHLANIPQAKLAHNLLTASATVDGNAVEMLVDRGSANAEAPLKVINTPGFDLPDTGDQGVWMYCTVGVVALAAACAAIAVICKKRKNGNDEEKEG